MKKALIFFALIIVVAVFILIVYQVKTISGSQSDDSTANISSVAVSVYVDNCARCHGSDGGGFGDKPAIDNTKMNVEEIKIVIQYGLAKMPAFQNIMDPVLSELAEYISSF